MDEAAVQREREMLVRFCARYTGNADAAEDLAQQTLVEAWRRQDDLRAPEARRAWLFAIARNTCATWARRRRADTPLDEHEVLGGDDLSDPEAAMMRVETRDLLDRILARLPAETRLALKLRYLADQPQSAVAAALGVSEGAAEARLVRGRAALRAFLGGEFRGEAVALGLAVEEGSDWRETRIYCPFCGRNHLLLQFDREAGTMAFRCAGMCTPTGAIASGLLAREAAGLTSPKAILTRTVLALGQHYDRAQEQGWRACMGCGRALWVECLPLDSEGNDTGIAMACPSCGTIDTATLWHLALDTPAAQRFWRRHPRIRALPAREDSGALVGGFESLATGERLRISFDAGYRVRPDGAA